MWLPMALMRSMSMIGILLVAQPPGAARGGWGFQRANGAPDGDFRMDRRQRWNRSSSSNWTRRKCICGLAALCSSAPVQTATSPAAAR